MVQRGKTIQALVKRFSVSILEYNNMKHVVSRAMYELRSKNLEEAIDALADAMPDGALEFLSNSETVNPMLQAINQLPLSEDPPTSIAEPCSTSYHTALDTARHTGNEEDSSDNQDGQQNRTHISSPIGSSFASVSPIPNEPALFTTKRRRVMMIESSSSSEEKHGGGNRSPDELTLG